VSTLAEEHDPADAEGRRTADTEGDLPGLDGESSCDGGAGANTIGVEYGFLPAYARHRARVTGGVQDRDVLIEHEAYLLFLTA
jgi:hypothetical protein